MKEKMKQEAIERMKRLGISSTAISLFEEDGDIALSVNPYRLAYGIMPEYKKLIDKWEAESGCMTYHAIYTVTRVGALLSLLFVSSNEVEWELDRENIDEGYPTAYVLNLNTPDFSGYGAISVENIDGVLKRIG